MINHVLCVCAQSFICVQLFVIPWTIACQTPLCMGFPRQEYRSGLPFPSLGDLSNPRIEPGSPTLYQLPWWLRWHSVCQQCGRLGFDPWIGKIP